jgi:hypothetical protein
LYYTQFVFEGRSLLCWTTQIQLLRSEWRNIACMKVLLVFRQFFSFWAYWILLSVPAANKNLLTCYLVQAMCFIFLFIFVENMTRPPWYLTITFCMSRDTKPDERNRKNSRMSLIYVMFYVTILYLRNLCSCNKEKQLVIIKSRNITWYFVTPSLYVPLSLTFEIT